MALAKKPAVLWSPSPSDRAFCLVPGKERGPDEEGEWNGTQEGLLEEVM